MSTLKLQTDTDALLGIEDWADTYTFSPTPKVVIASERIAVGDGDRQGTRSTWTITGSLLGAQAALITARDALAAAFAFTDATDKRLVLLGSDGLTVLDELRDETYRGLRVSQPVGYPEGAGVQWATMRDYSLALFAVTLDAGTAWGSVTTVVSIGMDGQTHKSVSGEYVGAGAQAAADAQKLSVDVLVISERQTEDEDQAKISFQYEYVDTSASREVISFVESVSAQVGGTDFVYQTVLGGDAPIKQDTVKRPWRATQSGSAVGRTGYPSFPSKRYSSTYLRPDSEERKDAPKRTADGDLTEYAINWNYVYEFPTSQGLVSPATPPA